jgi:hypothetical protein
VRRLQTRVDRRREDTGREDGIGEFEERIGAAIETLVEQIAEGVQGLKGSIRLHSEAFCSQRSWEATRCNRSLPAPSERKLSILGH